MVVHTMNSPQVGADPSFGPARVLLVEDDHDLRQSLADYLRLRSLIVGEAASGIEFYKALRQQSFDVAVLDVNLPDVTGFDLASDIATTKEMGVILLTARTAREDRIRGYGEGADLYLTKPVDSEELVLAIGNLARRTRMASGGARPAQSGTGKQVRLRLEREKRVLRAGDMAPVRLSAREVLLFEYLAAHAGETIKREEVLRLFGEPESNPDSRRLDAALTRLRGKFMTRNMECPLQVVYGAGLRLIEAVEIV
ncbi:MAG: response regulator transcription factor [Alphaproteobacteria bacterium]|nr:response regulator transcription factor [Alphaproteobacteria bacterium]